MKILVATLCALLTLSACGRKPHTYAAAPVVALSAEFQNYWNAGLAELSRFDLTQARYGKIHRGELIAIVVTEPFRTDKQVKSELSPGVSDTGVLKAQLMRRFATGIYDYAITTTSFKPLDTVHFPHALKVTGSAVDWCGHAWLQLNLKSENYAVQGRSYFEESADDDFLLGLAIAEDEIWQRIRIAPKALPVGKVAFIPPLHASRLRHRKLAVQPADAELRADASQKQSEYSLTYDGGLPSERRVSFVFEDSFPHRIVEYRETYLDGFGKPEKLTTIARLKKTIRRAYWRDHDPEHNILRREFGVSGFN